MEDFHVYTTATEMNKNLFNRQKVFDYVSLFLYHQWQPCIGDKGNPAYIRGELRCGIGCMINDFDIDRLVTSRHFKNQSIRELIEPKDTSQRFRFTSKPLNMLSMSGFLTSIQHIHDNAFELTFAPYILKRGMPPSNDEFMKAVYCNLLNVALEYRLGFEATAVYTKRLGINPHSAYKDD